MTEDVRPAANRCVVYTDSRTDKYTLGRGKWSGKGQSISRGEPFVLSSSLTFKVAGGPPIGTTGGAAHFSIQPIETDSRSDPFNLGAPAYGVDGGLLMVPFPATVTLVWPDLNPATEGELTFTLTSYGPDAGRGMPAIGVSEWHLTRLLEDGQTVAVPTMATRVFVPDSNYGVKVSLFSGSVVIEAPFVPVGLMGSPDVKIEILPALSGTVAPNLVPVLFFY